MTLSIFPSASTFNTNQAYVDLVVFDEIRTIERKIIEESINNNYTATINNTLMTEYNNSYSSTYYNVFLSNISDRLKETQMNTILKYFKDRKYSIGRKNDIKYSINSMVLSTPGENYTPLEILTVNDDDVSSSLSKAKAIVNTTRVVSHSIINGGTNYSIGDIITLRTGEYSEVAQFEVMNEYDGTITSLALINAGIYSTNPTISELVSGYLTDTTGSGNGAILGVTMGIDTFEIVSNGVYDVLPNDTLYTTSINGSNASFTYTSEVLAVSNFKWVIEW